MLPILSWGLGPRDRPRNCGSVRPREFDPELMVKSVQADVGRDGDSAAEYQSGFVNSLAADQKGEPDRRIASVCHIFTSRCSMRVGAIRLSLLAVLINPNVSEAMSRDSRIDQGIRERRAALSISRQLHT